MCAYSISSWLRLPRSVFDALGQCGRVGKRLLEAQQASLASLWALVRQPARPTATGVKKRERLPERCDESWFSATFCAGKQLEDGPVWDQVEGLRVYLPQPLNGGKKQRNG